MSIGNKTGHTVLQPVLKLRSLSQNVQEVIHLYLAISLCLSLSLNFSLFLSPPTRSGIFYQYIKEQGKGWRHGRTSVLLPQQFCLNKPTLLRLK